MNWETLDWAALDRLREGFLSGSAADGPYWRTEDDLACYDLTYGERIGWKWDAVLRELRVRGWRPRSRTVLDWGCGSGVAGRRVLAAFCAEHFDRLDVWDHSPPAREFAAGRAREAFPGLKVATWADDDGPVGLLVVSHVVNELPPEAREQLLALAARAEEILWVEPGTHADSRALAAVRDRLAPDFRIISPCTHRENCPLFAEANAREWCHFFASPPVGIQNDSGWVRFAQRAGIDLRSLPYSQLVLSRHTDAEPPAGSARVLGRIEHFKGFARLLACEAGGLHWLEMQKRANPALFKAMDRRPPVPLYRLEHDGRRIGAAEPLVTPLAEEDGADGA